jgi:Ser/Thr protein kinase RdoA (MazF antagonist)
VPVDAAWLERELIAPADVLAAAAADPTAWAAYHRWLVARCDAVRGAPAPRVAVHGDLTMANVLLDGDDAPGIVDWEAAHEEGMPLADLAYAAVDLVRAARRVGRATAFARCLAGGPDADGCARWLPRLARAIGVGAPLVGLALHACWLRHAANEVRRGLPADAWEFGAVTDWLARHHAAWQPWSRW